MVNQLCHHTLGNLGGVGVPPDRFKKRVNVHPLALALFQLQPQRLDPLGVLPLLLLVPLGHFRKPGVADFLAHVVLVKPLEKPVKLFVPRQQPIQLPLLPGPLILLDVYTFLETVRRYTNATEITQRMVAELIDHIDVYHAEKQDSPPAPARTAGTFSQTGRR